MPASAGACGFLPRRHRHPFIPIQHAGNIGSASARSGFTIHPHVTKGGSPRQTAPCLTRLAAGVITAMADVAVVGRRAAIPWRIALGVLLLAASAGNAARPIPPDAAGALGALIGKAVLLFGAIALIVSGVPRTLGTPAFVKARRRFWFRYLGVGLVMAVLLSIALSKVGRSETIALIPAAYWFGWTWISWLLADRQAKQLAMVVR